MNSFVIIILIVAIISAAILSYIFFTRDTGNFSMDIGGQTPTAAGGNDTSSEKIFDSRLTGLSVFSGTIVAALLARIFSMQLFNREEYSEQAESNRTRTITTAAPRGRILDRDGNELVTNRPSLTVLADPEVVDNEVEMRLLANLIGMPYLAVRRKIQSQLEGAQSNRTVAVDVSRRVVAFIAEHPYLFDNIYTEERPQRHYPNGSLAAHVLGYTGSITADQLEWSWNHEGEGNIAYESSDTVGQAGVEYQYESVLQGIRGEQVVYVDAYGTVLDYSTSIAAQSGSDVVLTINAKVQKAAEESLAKRIKLISESTCEECDAGAAVCMDVTNGEIIAMASYPTYSPNVFIGGIAYSDWESLSSEKSGYPLINRAISGLYPSASTIKPLSTFAALDNGVAKTTSEYYCTGFWTGFGEDYGQYCWNHNGHGAVDIELGIVYSCDVVFYEIGKSFYSQGSNGLQETYRKWGLGSTVGIDLPSEEAGRVPDAEWKWNYWAGYSDDDRTWQGGDSTNLAIGQGDLLVTPLQIACAYAGIANRGTVWRPHVLKSVRSASGSGTVIDHKAEVAFEVEESASEYDLIQRALVSVIYDESEAQAEHFTNMTARVAGKTGTAERAGRADATGWFVAYVPADKPKYVVAATIEQGGFGNVSSLYVVRDIMGAIYDEPDTSTAVDTSGVR